MPEQSNQNNQVKTAVSVAEMARMVGLSRARFYQLIGTTFPHPVYNVLTRRPLYVEEQQRECLEVRRRNCGIDGKAILFYARRVPTAPQPNPRPRKIGSAAAGSGGKASRREALRTHRELIDALAALGVQATPQEASQALREAFPVGSDGLPVGEIIPAVFRAIKRRNRADNAER